MKKETQEREREGASEKKQAKTVLYDAMIVNTHVYVDTYSQGLF